MKKITSLASAFALILFFALSSRLHAQEEYRISQPISANIDSLFIKAGWNVLIKQGDKASIAIVTVCHAFFDNDNEPEVCKIEGNTLTMLENNSMPQSTVVEITLNRPLKALDIAPNAIVTTQEISFNEKVHIVTIGEHASVNGSVWRSPKSLSIHIYHDASLKMDSIVAGNYLNIYQHEGAILDCPAMVSLETTLSRAKIVNGPIYISDAAKHLTVKTKGYLAQSKHALVINGGITAPIPLYMNNRQGSPYNRGENYRLNINASVINVNITKHLSFTPYLRYEVDWSRLLNTVKKDGDALVLDNSYGAINPHQLLYAENLGIDYSFTFSFGKKNPQTGMNPYHIKFGIEAMYNISSRLVTRTMGDDNRWHRTRDKVDVFNPWQLRAHLGIGGGPLTRATLSLTYDLLPTFRSDIGADKLHTFGVNISF